MRILIVLIILSFISCQQAPPGSLKHIQKVTESIDDNAILNADMDPGNWLSYGRNYAEQHYSELDQINPDNLDQLGLAWTLDLGTNRGVEATPLVVDGIMYITGPWSMIYCIDARNGTLIWEYDPQVPREMAEHVCCDVVNRGAALYKGDIFFGTLDGRLISLDAAQGSLNWEIQTTPKDRHYTITGAPRIVKGRVIIGNGGADYDARGFVSAYEAETGEMAWRFYTVPGNPGQEFENPILKEAAETWTGEWWTMGGGGTVWDAIVYDPDLNLIYIGVGNGSPWDRNIRSPEGGDNLFLSSIVALNADDGSYVWHYQTTPGDTWDYTATQPLVLADLEIDGATRKVIMQAPKNGFFYVIDRTNGEFISASPYTYLNWAKGMDENGRPIEEEFARYNQGGNVAISPGPFGGHNWQPMAFNPITGLMYIPTHTIASVYSYNDKFVHNQGNEGTASGSGWNVSYFNKLYKPTRFDPDGKTNPADPTSPYGRLIAYDPVNQREVWAQRMVSHWNGGVLATSTGLVFQGNAEGKFVAYDASSGENLWEFDIRSGAIAAPVTYLIDGEQYITIPVGWGGITGLNRKFTDRVYPGTVYTFKLGGMATPPAKSQEPIADITQISPSGTPVQIGHGFTKYVENCIQCHGDGFGLGGGVLPDLTRSTEDRLNSYKEIVLDGILAQNGMPSYRDRLSEQDVEDIKQFVLYTSNSLRQGMPNLEFITSIAQMQYLADIEPTIKD